jgi:hypothetical protein
MAQGLSWKVGSHLGDKEFPCFLWNLKFHYYIHHNPQLGPILCQMNLFHTVYL